MPSIDEEIKQQEDFVKAISYQKEVAINAYYDAKEYMDRIVVKHVVATAHLNALKGNK